MHGRVLVFLAALAATAAPAAAPMTVAEFLTRAAALEKKGVTALFARDYAILKQEVKSAGMGLRRDTANARSSGRRPAVCLPEDKVPVNSGELLSYFRSIPPAQGGVTVAAAFTAMMKRKYPCPA